MNMKKKTKDFTQNTFNSLDKRLEIYTPDLTEFKSIEITKLKEIENTGEEYCNIKN